MVKRMSRRAARAICLAAGMSLTLAAAAGPAHAASVDKERSEKYLQDAQDYLKKHDLNAAVIQLKNALKSDPGNVAARRLLGEAYLDVGNGAYAEKELSTAIQRGAPFGEIAPDLGRAYLQQGKYDQVIKQILPDKVTPDNKYQVLIERGQAYLSLRQLDDAEKSFNAAHEMKPKDASAMVGLAQTLINRGKVKEADAEVDQALAAAPDDVGALTMKGELRRIVGDRDGAIKYFDKALAKRQNNVLALLGRAAALIDQNKDDAAQKDLKRVLTLVPKHPMALYLEALTLAKKRDYAGAREKLEDAGPALDDHMPSVFLKGAVAYALGEPEQAIKNLTFYLDRIPGNLRARELLAATYVRLRQPQKVVDTLKPALKPVEDTYALSQKRLAEAKAVKDGAEQLETEQKRHNAIAAEYARFMSMIGTAYMQLGKVNEGTSYFSKAAEAAPDAASIRTQLALSHLAQGQSAEATGDLKMALDIDKDSSRAGILLALIQLRKGQYDDALASAKKLKDMKSMAGNPLPENLMGAAYLGKNDKTKAVEMFDDALKVKPDFAPAHMNLAQLAIRDKDYDKARSQYETVLKDNPKSVEAMTALANLANIEKKPDEVAKWLRAAGDADPKGIAPQLRLIAFYDSQRNFPMALNVARQLNIDVPNNPRVLEVLGRSELAAGNPDRAISTFRQLTDQQPKSGRALVLLAGAQIANKTPDQARDTLNKAISIDPNYIPAHVSLVQLETREKHYDAAIKVAEALTASQPKASLGDMLRGDVLMAEKKTGPAIEAYKAGMKRAEFDHDGPAHLQRRAPGEAERRRLRDVGGLGREAQGRRRRRQRAGERLPAGRQVRQGDQGVRGHPRQKPEQPRGAQQPRLALPEDRGQAREGICRARLQSGAPVPRGDGHAGMDTGPERRGRSRREDPEAGVRGRAHLGRHRLPPRRRARPSRPPGGGPQGAGEAAGERGQAAGLHHPQGCRGAARPPEERRLSRHA